MRRGANVFILCSPDARVGVSTTARLLTDYHLYSGVRVEGFDTDPHEPHYGDRFSDYVNVVDAAEIKGQIALFDRLLADDETPKIVDVWHRVFSRFFSTVQEIGFFEEARRRNLAPIILYHAAPTETALAGARALSASWPEVEMLIVQNEGAAPLGSHPWDTLRHYPANGKFVIPALEGPVAKILDAPSLSLSGFLRAPPTDMSIVVRAALKGWITPIFTQFNSFEMRQELRSSLYLS